MRTEIEICSQITVHAVSMFVIRVLHHVALHSVYAYSCTESIAPMARAQRQPGRGNTQEEKWFVRGCEKFLPGSCLAKHTNLFSHLYTILLRNISLRGKLLINYQLSFMS